MQTIELPPSQICKLANVMSFLDIAKEELYNKPVKTSYTLSRCLSGSAASDAHAQRETSFFQTCQNLCENITDRQL